MSPTGPRQWLGQILRGPRTDAPAPEAGGQPAAPRRRHPEPTLDDDVLRATWQSVSLLLGYPDDELLGLLPRLEAVALRLPEEVGAPLLRLIAHLGGTPVGPLRSAYVDTFDTTRKCALHLTYYSYGDTRKRGVALVQFKQAYRRGGLEVSEDELPDHLSVLLEFGATGDRDIAWKLLNDHRAGIELLQLGLDARTSPWADAVQALRATLPPLDGTQSQAVARLLAEGPPNEDVGMDAYALDPRLNPHPDDDALSLDVTGATR